MYELLKTLMVLSSESKSLQSSFRSRRLQRLVLLGLCGVLTACQQVTDRLSQMVGMNPVEVSTHVPVPASASVPESSAPLSVPVQTASAWPAAPAKSEVPAPTQPASVGTLLRQSPSTAPASVSKAMGAQPLGLFQDCPACPRMVTLPVGHVLMGSPVDEPGRDDDESPRTRVAVVALAIGQTEVTRSQWQIFERESGHRAASGCLRRSEEGYVHEAHLGWRYPGFAQTDEHPVVCISWLDAQAYAQWLSRKTGKSYRLPTESEWEYAARAGTSTPYPWPGGADRLCEQANGADEALSRRQSQLRTHGCNDGHAFTAPVGSFAPNAWGLYDMHGNVMEWVQDCWSPQLQSQAAPLRCHSRVTRGGGWDLAARYLRSAYRGKAPQVNQGSATGFRLVRSLP